MGHTTSVSKFLLSHKERNLSEWFTLRKLSPRDSPFLINYACLRLWLRVGFTKYLTGALFYGNSVERLEKGKTADVAGLKIGDLIIGVNGEDVSRDPNTTIFTKMK